MPRGATDSRVTEVFDAILPRRLRRRYADDAPSGPARRNGPPAGHTPDGGAPDSGTADSGTADSGTADSGTADSDAPDSGAADSGAPRDGAPDSGSARDGEPDGAADRPGPAAPPPGTPPAGPIAAPPGGPPADDPHRRRLRAGAAVLAVLVLLTTAWGFVGRSQVYGGVRTVAALAPTSDAISDAGTQAADRNVLVLGLQANRATNPPPAARTDTAVLVHQPAGDAPAVTLAFPATLEVSRPPCRRWDPTTGAYGETVPAESRIAFATAYDVGGPACTVDVVQQLTGMPVTGFVAFDLAGTPGLVAAVGGVEVCTERPVVDRVLGAVVPDAGRIELDPATAREFVSATAVADSSPADRVQRQQRVLGAALGDALSTSSLLTPGLPGRVAEGLSGSVVADGLSAGEILGVARGLSRAGTAGDGSTPTFLQVPVTEAPNTRGHLEMRDSEASSLFSALREHEPLPAEVTAPQARAVTTVPAGVTVDLVDATGLPGRVEDVAASLRERGYTIGSVTTGPVTEDTAVRYSPNRTDAAGALTEALPAARPAPDPTSSGRLEVVVGSAVRAPGPATVGGTAVVDCG